MFRQLTTIAGNTFTEAIRQPIFVVLLLLGIATLVINPALSAYSMESGSGDNKMLIDLGLSTVFLAGLLLAAFTATGVLSEEVTNRTVLTVVSKPVPRPVFILGKFLGVAGAIALAYYILSLGFLLSLRHGVMQTARHEFDQPVLLFSFLAALISVLVAAWGNYFYRKVFNSTLVLSLGVAATVAFLLVLVIGKGWTLQSPVTQFAMHDGRMGQVVLGLIMVMEAVIVLTAVAIACSTRLGQVMTLMVCVGIFALGLVSNSFDDQVDRKLEISRDLGLWASFGAVFATEMSWALKLVFAGIKALHLLVPNLQFLWPGEAITQGYTIHFTNIAALTVYAALYTAAVLGVAVILFQRREVG
jgi:ABC-type transport system involved in multi-copper enzyme maturation permease subunit